MNINIAENATPIEILLVEDSAGDVRLTQEALRDAKVRNNLHVVSDGMEATYFLWRQGKHANAPRPDLILLDLNLPMKGGREVLEEIKLDANLKSIPVVILTTSAAEEDILRSYQLHANCYITKPVDLDQFLKVVKTIDNFWLAVVKLPANRKPMIEKTVNVLLIEDNAGDARLLREMFNHEAASRKYSLAHQECMKDAVTHLAADPVDVVLLDLGLPDAEGLGAVRQVHAVAPSIPLVVVTGLDDEAVATQALQEGVQDYLIKGQIETHALLRSLRYAIERQRMQIETDHVRKVQLQLKDEFLSHVSHELRSPLTRHLPIWHHPRRRIGRRGEYGTARISANHSAKCRPASVDDW